MVAGKRFDEQAMTFVEAAGWLERRFGRRPNVASIWRWATKGIKGVRLATIALGRFRYTTESALERFIAETSLVEASRGIIAANASKGTEVTSKPSAFTKADVTAATRRREQEKAKALQYLRSRLGVAGRNAQAPSSPNEIPEGPTS